MEIIVLFIPTAGLLSAPSSCLPQVSKPICNFSDIPEEENVTIFSE